MLLDRRAAFALVYLSNLLGIAASFPTWEMCTKPGVVHLPQGMYRAICLTDADVPVTYLASPDGSW